MGLMEKGFKNSFSQNKWQSLACVLEMQKHLFGCPLKVIFSFTHNGSLRCNCVSAKEKLSDSKGKEKPLYQGWVTEKESSMAGILRGIKTNIYQS